jgi:hypothetical protein
VDYLEAVADRIVCVLSGRPLSVIRVRAGQRPFMQKNVPDYAPPWIRTVSMWAESSHREVRYALCEDKPTLIWFANQRAVEYHVTLGTAGHPARQAMREGKCRARAQRGPSGQVLAANQGMDRGRWVAGQVNPLKIGEVR